MRHVLRLPGGEKYPGVANDFFRSERERKRKDKTNMSKKQDELKIEGIGVSPVRIKEVDAALDEYIPIKEKRCTLTPKEVAAKEKVMEKMRKNADKIGADGEGALVYR